jgi:tRNA(fMet)-specific endonuclease VapC
MNGGSYLLDTNVIAAILNQEPAVEGQLKSKSVYLCSIALGELYFGAYKSTRIRDNLKRITDFVDHYPVLTCDQATAESYGRVKAMLKQKGRPIPENDIWIAAIALQYDSTLVTRDEHFKQVDGLHLETW